MKYMRFALLLAVMLCCTDTHQARAQRNDDGEFMAQWKFSGDKHKSLQVETERIFHQRYPLVML